jgi:hypothetical protein
MIAGLRSRVIGVRVSMPWYITAQKYADRINELNRFMQEIDTTVPFKKVGPRDRILIEDYLGKAYAAFTDGAQAINKKSKRTGGAKTRSDLYSEDTFRGT